MLLFQLSVYASRIFMRLLSAGDVSQSIGSAVFINYTILLQLYIALKCSDSLTVRMTDEIKSKKIIKKF